VNRVIGQRLVWASLFFLPGLCLPILGFALEVPPHTRQVMDLADVLNPEEEQQIEQSLQLFQKEYGPQIQVLTIPSLEGEPIESYSIKVVDVWKLGTKKNDDGVLLLVVPQDHEVRIEVGQGLEGQLPDILAGRIIRDVMIPFFKKDRYDAGIFSGLNAIASRLGGTLKNVPVFAQQKPHSRESGLGTLLFIFIFFFIILPRLFGGGRDGKGRRDRFGRRKSGADDFITGMILGNIFGSGRRGGGGPSDGGFGSGGFGGGGGGGFSGGGASGKW
jgi:uncharacterized protein